MQHWTRYLLLVTLLLTACSRHNEPPQPAQFWGGIGFSYEANKVSGGKSGSSPETAAHVGFEKELGGGLGIGVEVAGTRD
jgi:hypothetical protein